ncbi:hypothetical protein P7C70_g867, partial [Phenoliferia sp. Uapishka_3]
MSESMYPPFPYSLYERCDGLGVLAFKFFESPHPEATPLVMVHGLTSTGLVDWLPLAFGLAETRPVLIFDNRNMGKSVPHSPSAKDAFKMSDLAKDVIELVEVAATCLFICKVP